MPPEFELPPIVVNTDQKEEQRIKRETIEKMLKDRNRKRIEPVILEPLDTDAKEPYNPEKKRD